MFKRKIFHKFQINFNNLRIKLHAHLKIPVSFLNLETIEDLKDNKEEMYLLKEIHKNNHNR